MNSPGRGPSSVPSASAASRSHCRAVGVLELVDQKLADLPPQPATHPGAPLQQVGRPVEKIVEGQHPCALQAVADLLDERAERQAGELEAAQVEREEIVELLVRQRARSR